MHPAPELHASDTAVAEAIERIQRARAARTPLCIVGGGTKQFYGGLPAGEALSTRALTGVVQYEPSELVVTVRAGTPLAELESLLARSGQCLPFEPPHFGAGATVGGMVATGLAGPSRMSAGSVRDFILGVTMVNGRGELLAFGGQVMKNVAGYDLSRLMTGSMGVLGLIVEVSLKVLPRAPAEATLAFEATQAEALGRLTRWGGQPLPLSASCWHAGRLMLRLRGARAAVDAARVALGGEAVDDTVARDFWHSLREHTHPFFAPTQGGGHLWRIAVPDTAPPTADTPLIEWGGAQRWRHAAASESWRDEVRRAGGHVTCFRAQAEGDLVRRQAFTSPEPAAWRIHQRLKHAFDPDALFNPGRLYADL